jgi:hypothetical protein
MHSRKWYSEDTGDKLSDTPQNNLWTEMLTTNLLDMSWTAALSFENVQISALLCNMLTTVSQFLNISASSLYLYGNDRVGGAGVAKEWNLS